MFHSPLMVLLFIFAVCSFYGKEFVSLRQHSWRCKSKLHCESESSNARNISSPLLPPESIKVVTNGSKNVNCSCGQQCKGLKGLKAQRSCRIIQGLRRGGSRHSPHSHRRMSDFITEILYCKQSTPQSYNFSFTYLKEYNRVYLIASISNCLVPINQRLELIVKQ